MVALSKHLTSISPDLRSGSSPGRRLLAAVLCAMLALGSTAPGLAMAGEADSEGQGTGPSIEVPVDPDFDPGGEETALEETPAAEIEEEGGAVEVEAQVETEVPATGEVTSTVTEGTIEEEQSPAEVPPIAAAEPEPEPVEQKAPEPSASEVVANQSLAAPKEKPAERPATHEPQAMPPADAVPPAAPVEDNSPSPASPPPSGNSDLSLAGKRFYVVQPGDCLTYIAESLLPPGATESEIEVEVDRLWRLNEDHIGTGDPDLIYAGTTLQLRRADS